ncbi:GGDEF domain-containing protein [Azovibrio restrictus]|uniref:GGDEF domain-containing protein n=1 Tax=Azovibrio restrictus TaxID=146938 RepID=UPI00047B11E0|nr:GGDEF domain-containing protein [Azovibrio restrictus]
MTAPSNPTEIAREAFRQLAARRVPPTPDNYRVIYSEVAGQPFSSEEFPEKQLKQLAHEVARIAPEQARLGRELDEAIKYKDWGRFRKVLTDHVATLTEVQRLAWAELIGDLFRQWEAKSGSLTQGKKRESLEHVLNSSSANSRLLFGRLENLQRAWSQGSTSDGDEISLSDAVPVPDDAPGVPTKPSDLLPEFRELFAYALESCIAPLLAEQPKLAQETEQLAQNIRAALSLKQMQDIQGALKRFAFKLELQVEDQVELRASLLKLLRLVVENISELVLDDQWMHGQIEVIRGIVEKPLSQRAIDDAEQRLKEVIFKQGQLKLSLQEAQDALKSMLAGFVDHLADFAGATSDYHNKIEKCAAKIGAADNINDLESVLTEVMQETRNIQINALRSHDELQQTRQRVQEAENQIKALEKELAETSHLIRHDQLTGVLNRRGLEEIYEKETARAQRHETPICLALLDIDNFKKLNDSLGHSAGDDALVHLATVIRETLRPQDTVARFGGEEFIIIFPDTTLAQASTAMVRVQRELTRRIFMHEHHKVLITFSAGVTALQPDDNLGTVTRRADEAMYQAKQSGKNKVITT